MKKCLAWMLAVCLMLSMAACGKNEPNTQTTGAASPEPSTQGSQNVTEPSNPPETSQPETTQPNSTEPSQPEEIYDENGRLVESVSGDVRTLYEYDDRGNLLEEYKIVRGTEESRTSCRYDDANRVISQKYLEKGKEMTCYEYTYNKDGTLATKSYSEKGKAVWVDTYRADGGYVHQTFPQEHEVCWETYSADGLLMELLFHWDGVESTRSVFYYNSQRKLLRDEYYEDGVYVMATEYFYDADGNEIRTRVDLPTVSPESNLKTTFQRVHKVYRGNKLRTVSFREGNVLTKEWRYNDREEKVTELLYQAGKVSMRSEFEYDSRGNVVRQTVFDGSGAEQYRREYVYDNANRLTQSTLKEQYTLVTQYTYDESGKLLTAVTTADGEVYESEEYRYVYQSGKLFQQDRLFNGELVETCYYNEQGRLVEEVTFADGQEVSSVLYTYQGNYTHSWQEIPGGECQHTMVHDSLGTLLKETVFRNGTEVGETRYNRNGEVTHTIRYDGEEPLRVVMVYEYVQEQPGKNTVVAQRISSISFPAIDNSPFACYFDYEGGSLKWRGSDSDDFVETRYNGDPNRPLQSQWVDSYTGSDCRRERTYDDQGRLILDVIMDGDTESYKVEYAYDDQGNCTDEVWYWDGLEGERTTCTYDAQGRLTEKVSVSDGQITCRFTYTYDEATNTVREQVESGGGNSCTEMTYNDRGDLVEEVYSVEGVEYYRYSFRYDEKGVLLEKEYRDGETDLLYTYEYDKAGRLTHVYAGDFPETIWLYNESGKLSEMIQYSDQDITEIVHHRYLYDENGMLYEVVLQYGDYKPGSVLITYDTVEVTPEEAAMLEDLLMSELSSI